MRRVLPLCAFLATLTSGPGSSHADELDGWCAQAKKASSLVICSDAELRQQAIARNKLFEEARAKLGPEAYKALTGDQSRWIKSYTAQCGVALDGPMPSLPIPQSFIDCYRRESRARTAELTRRLSAVGAAPPSALSSDPDRRAKEIANEALVGIGIPRPEVEAMAALDDCTEAAVDRFADQPEPARTVAEAAMAACGVEESKYLIAKHINDPSTLREATIALREATMPDLLARVMTIRAARAKLRQESPKASRAIQYNRM